MKFRFLYFSLLVLSTSAFGQTPIPFSTISYVDINNIKAATLVHGDMWWNPVTQLSQCEFPKGSGKSIAFSGSLWMSGFDAGNNLHISAQTYRQAGNDYWPGPLDNNDTLTYANSQSWAHIWKINRSDLNTFRNTSPHTTTNVPNDILTWPAKGNPYAMGGFGSSLTISNDMAPFIDVDSDGTYNALNGDYPDIKGDQALWWIFSDNGPTHTETNGTPLKVEVQCMAYAYNRGTLIDNVIYYDYSIVNRSSNDYTNFRIGQFADMDLGYSSDDYIGFYDKQRLGFVYNADSSDGTGQTNSYGREIPTAGVTMIILPGDNANGIVPAGSFMYYRNDFSALGSPFTATEYNNYLRSMWRDSTHVKYDFAGQGIASTGNGTGPDINYVFNGNPDSLNQWSECASQNMGGDRRFIITSNDFTLLAGSKQHVVMALVTTNPDTNHYCGNFNIDDIKTVTDTAWYVYEHPLSVSVHNIYVPAYVLEIFPNPAKDVISIKGNRNKNATIVVYNSIGQKAELPATTNGNLISLNIKQLASGVYYIVYREGESQRTGSFVKE